MNKINHVIIYVKNWVRVFHHRFQTPRNRWKHKAKCCYFLFFFWGVWKPWWNMKFFFFEVFGTPDETWMHKFLISFLKKQYRFTQCQIFGIFLLKCCCTHNLLYFLVIWYYNMCKPKVFRFSEPKPVLEEEDLSDKTIPTSVKYKNKSLSCNHF